MKRNLLISGLTLILIGGAILTSCKKDDTVAPTITLTGASSMNVRLGTTFTDPGYTASDDKDGDITSKVTMSGMPNMAKVGTYTMTYSVSDAAGNAGTATRTVVVYTGRDNYVYSNYSVVEDTCGTGAQFGTFSSAITASGTLPEKIIFTNFVGVSGFNLVEGIVSSPSSGVDSSRVTLNWSGVYNGDSFVITGTGDFNNTGTVLSLQINWSDNTISFSGCETDVYTKQ